MLDWVEWKCRRMHVGSLHYTEFVTAAVRIPDGRKRCRGILCLSAGWCRAHVTAEHRGLDLGHSKEGRLFRVRPTYKEDCDLAFSVADHPVVNEKRRRGYRSSDLISIASFLITLGIAPGPASQWPLVEQDGWWVADLSTVPTRRGNKEAQA